MSRNPFVFVVGCPRSGTTLLQRMLDHHPRLAVSNDTHFIPKAIEGLSDGTDLPLSPDLVDRVRNYRRFRRLGVSDDAVERAVAAARTYREFVSGLYTEFGRSQNKPLAGEKTPDYVRCLPLLHALFPWARSVHIIRDGRDVALSTLEWANENKGPGRLEFWRTEPVAVCALWWRWQVMTGRNDGRVLGPDRYHELRYEDLVNDPGPDLNRVTDFLGLPFAQEMIEYHVGKFRDDPGLSAKKAWAPPTAGLRDWRTAMNRRDLELFEAIASDLLADMGYEIAFLRISPDMRALAGRCAAWWDQDRARRRAARGGAEDEVD